MGKRETLPWHLKPHGVSAVKKYKLVRVWWPDSQGEGTSWEYLRTVVERDVDLTHVSVGYLVRENSKFVTIAGHLGAVAGETPNCVGGVFHIPRAAITKMETLK